MRLIWAPQAWEDYLFWQDHDRDVVRKIADLIKATRRDPFRGHGKPEPLKQTMRGWWSRRITGKHRLVYRISGTGADQALELAQCRYHY